VPSVSFLILREDFKNPKQQDNFRNRISKYCVLRAYNVVKAACHEAGNCLPHLILVHKSHCSFSIIRIKCWWSFCSSHNNSKEIFMKRIKSTVDLNLHFSLWYLFIGIYGKIEPLWVIAGNLYNSPQPLSCLREKYRTLPYISYHASWITWIFGSGVGLGARSGVGVGVGIETGCCGGCSPQCTKNYCA